MKNELKGIYDYIGPNKHDSKIVIRPDQVEKIIKEFGHTIAFWIHAEQSAISMSVHECYRSRVRSTKYDLNLFLKWLGGD